MEKMGITKDEERRWGKRRREKKRMTMDEKRRYGAKEGKKNIMNKTKLKQAIKQSKKRVDEDNTEHLTLRKLIQQEMDGEKWGWRQVKNRDTGQKNDGDN